MIIVGIMTILFVQLGDYWKMPVPSSYNDVTANSTIRDYVGWSWYQYEFYVPKRWSDDQLNVFIRFGSVHFKSIVVRTIFCNYF